MRDSDINTDVLIIGAGQAGGRAALTLRNQEYSGDIRLIGAESFAPYQRPPLSKDVLTGKKEIQKALLVPEEHYAEKKIDLDLSVSAEQANLDKRQVATSNGDNINYQHLVFATGAYPRQLAVQGAQLQNVFTFRTAEDVAKLAPLLKEKTNLVIIGGGFIGLEIASSARVMGCKVTVLEAQSDLLSRSMPVDAATDVVNIHRQNGVDIITNALTQGFFGSEKVESVKLVNGTEIAADVVVVGIGIIAATQLAEQSGLEVNNGIVTDEYARTSTPNVYAIGDCASTYIPRYGRHLRLESFQNANMQANVVAHTIIDKPIPYNPVPWVWSQQYDWLIQTAGFHDQAEAFVKRGSLEKNASLYYGVKEGKLCAVVGVGKAVAVAKPVRMAQMLIENNIEVNNAQLSDEQLDLKSLLS